jgi:hypothetical protein
MRRADKIAVMSSRRLSPLTGVVWFVVALWAGSAGAGRFALGAPVPAYRAAPAGQSASGRVDGDALIRDLEALASPALEGRLTGTAGNRKAQAFIAERFKQLGLRPVGGSHEQRFSFPKREAGKPTPSNAVNLMGLVRGTVNPQSVVIVSAHYDHLGVLNGQVYPGADDNASGVAALLAIAAWFAGHPPRSSLLFVAFDAEEEGLHGARHFVATRPVPLARIATVVNIDMIGRGDANRLFVVGTHHYPSLKPVVSEAATGSPIEVAFGHDQPASQASGMDDWTNQSDHAPFHAAGIPFLYFGVEDHADYHKPSDTADKIPRRFYLAATELVLETVRRLADR